MMIDESVTSSTAFLRKVKSIKNTLNNLQCVPVRARDKATFWGKTNIILAPNPFSSSARQADVGK